IVYGLFRPLFLLRPGAAADPRQRGARLAAADILLHQLDHRGRHKQLRLASEFEFKVLYDLVSLIQQPQAQVTGDAMPDVNDVISLAQVEEAVDYTSPALARGAVRVGAVE